jgi:hypothetical protein
LCESILRPLVPQDLIERHRDGNRALIRTATRLVRATGTKGFAAEVSRELYPDDKSVPLILRAATSPNVLAGSALAGYDQLDPVILAGASASAQLINSGLRINLDGRGMVMLPAYVTSSADAGSFIQEGNPIPVRALNFSVDAATVMAHNPAPPVDIAAMIV